MARSRWLINITTARDILFVHMFIIFYFVMFYNLCLLLRSVKDLLLYDFHDKKRVVPSNDTVTFGTTDVSLLFFFTLNTSQHNFTLDFFCRKICPQQVYAYNWVIYPSVVFVVMCK